jgi:hypothetical protein
VALAVAVLGLGGVWVGGCATGNTRRDQQIAKIGGRPSEPTPKGGWSNYKPDRRLYEPDPARAAATQSVAPKPDVTGNLQ